MSVASINAGTGVVELISTGTIRDTVGDDTSVDITGSTLTILSTTGVGATAADALNLAVTNAGVTNSTGNVFITDADDLTLQSIAAPNLTVIVDADDNGSHTLDLGSGTLNIGGGAATMQLAGTSNNDTLQAQNAVNTWIISAANNGTLNGTFANFSSFGQISGGNTTDTTNQSLGGAAAGTIDVVLSAPGTVDGMAGTITGLINFDNIDSIINDDIANTITGAPSAQIANATWTIDGLATENYQDNATGKDLDFSNTFRTLTGGSGNDTFNISSNYTADLIGDPSPAGDGADRFVFSGTALLTGAITAKG
jgi:hypothetical protein